MSKVHGIEVTPADKAAWDAALATFERMRCDGKSPLLHALNAGDALAETLESRIETINVLARNAASCRPTK